MEMPQKITRTVQLPTAPELNQEWEPTTPHEFLEKTLEAIRGEWSYFSGWKLSELDSDVLHVYLDDGSEWALTVKCTKQYIEDDPRNDEFGDRS